MAKNKRRKVGGKHHAVRKSLNAPSAVKSAKPAKKPQQQPTIPFEPEDRILLVGEGDFSFARSIVEHHGCCDVTATCLDSKEELIEKYKPQVEEHIKYIEDEGQAVLFAVDATKLQRKELRNSQRFDRILFNFPHIGGKSTDVNRQVRANQELLVKFFGAATTLLAQDGTIIVTLFEGEPYTLWNIRDLARHSGLEVQKSFRFVAEAYTGYSHARTLGNIGGGGGWKGEDRDARSYVFEAKKTGQAPNRQTLLQDNDRKRKWDDGSSDDEDEE